MGLVSLHLDLQCEVIKFQSFYGLKKLKNLLLFFQTMTMARGTLVVFELEVYI